MKSIKKRCLPLLVFLLIGTAIYFPILNNEFLSDDYDSLYRICIEHTILIKEFFRPLIDISFKFNYIFGGLDAKGYYIFNLLIHVFNAYLVYAIGKSFQIKFEGQELFAWLSALLFLFYPFHNEAVVWLSGRLSSIACFFALISIRIIYTNIRTILKAVLIGSFYMIGLLAYESILFLPFIVLIFLWHREFSLKQNCLMLAASVVVIIIYLLFRYYVSDAVYGEYGARMTDNDNWLVIIKAAKTLGRTILPPSENSFLLSAFFIAGLGFFAFLTVKLYKKYSFVQLTVYSKLMVAFSLSMAIPMLFGISTRTSESDRLLYFPSVFLCMLLSFLLIALLQSKIKRLLTFSALTIYFLLCLTYNILNWEKASQLAKAIFDSIEQSKNKEIIVINMPDEVEGAFVFRNGFFKAISLNGLDTSKIHVNNYLTRLEYLELNKIHTLHDSVGIFVPPVSKLTFGTPDTVCIDNLASGNKMFFNKNNVTVIYWDKNKIKQLF